MEIGIGLPTTVPGADGARLLEWARRSDEAGFSTLGVLDRLVYDNVDPLIGLAAAAAVTRRIRLATTILIAPYRHSPALLAKQGASLQELSGGRFVLGVAAGGRDDDYLAAGTTYRDRGRRLDALLADVQRIWSGEPAEAPAGGATDGIVGPVPQPTPPVLVGGHSAAAMRRAARFGSGWIAGGSPAAGFAALAGQLRLAWNEAGRTERPRTVALAYVSLGPGGPDRAERYLRRYYAFLGAKADRAAAGVLVDPVQVRDLMADFADAGCDELLLFPCDADPGQVELIAKAALP